MTFANPIYLLLLLLLIPYIVWYILYHKTMHPQMRVSSTEAYRFLKKTWKIYFLHVPMLLRCACFTAAIVALARPQTINSWDKTDVEGIDIMLCMDISSSMLAEDLKPNRMKAARDVAIEFISGRPNDNIGLTLFAGEVFTQCPMTTGHSVLINMLQSMQPELTATGIIEDGTAIGMGLANAITRLKDSRAKSKVIILLTDGSNNCGDISPNTAAQIAKEYGIRVYTIGVGTTGLARYPLYGYGNEVEYIDIPVEIDINTLRSIAENTDGKFYRAQNTKALYDIYKEIDKLERTKIIKKNYTKRHEAFMPFAILAIIALMLEIFVQNTVLKRIP